MQETANPEQVYGTRIESETLLPMNELDIEFGYVLYEANLTVHSEDAVLEIENIRDYAVVYLDDQFQGTVTDNRKKLLLPVEAGEYTLRLYAENIGRITYGPEILDNQKGLFGTIAINGEKIENWQMTHLQIRETNVQELDFSKINVSDQPCFYRAYFEISEPGEWYLDVSGWGMGEVWINGCYLGSYWEEEKQQSIQVPVSLQKEGKNELIVFELKNNKQTHMVFSEEPVFK